MIEKLDMKSMDITEENVKKIQALFPSAVTEVIVDGKTTLKIDFDVLKQELSANLIEDKQERYQMTWPDKSKAKVLANSRITSTLRPDKEKSVDFDNTQNLYIEGDNLDVLKLLRETYLGKVDVIYIDPPYNTGFSLIYNNNFFDSAEEFASISGEYDEYGNRLYVNSDTNGRYHTNWLNMIYPRLKVAKDLLKDTGILVLTIDDYEVNTITTVLNEIFGEINHLGTVVIKNNPSGRSTVKGFSVNHEYALFYSKTTDATLGRLKHNDAQKSRYKERDEKGFYEWENFRKNGTDSDRKDRPKQFFPIIINKDMKLRIPNVTWSDIEKKYHIQDVVSQDEDILYPVAPNGLEKVWKYGIERTREIISEILVKSTLNGYELYRKKYLNEEGTLPHTWWDKPEYSARDNGTRTLTNIFGPAKLFDFPKAPQAVKDALQSANLCNGGLVLDFFSGSATTAHAVMQLNAEDGGNRKFIMVQLPEECDEKSEAYKAGYKTICEIGEERIRRAGAKIKEEKRVQLGLPTFTEHFNTLINAKGDEEHRKLIKEYEPIMNLDTGFRVLKLDSSNMQDVYYNPNAMRQSLLDLTIDNVKSDRTPLDLLFQVMLDLGVELSAKIEEKQVNGKTYFVVNGNDLIACFDEDIDNDVITEIAKQQPLYAVFKSTSFATDSASINNEQLFKTYSPATVIKVI